MRHVYDFSFHAGAMRLRSTWTDSRLDDLNDRVSGLSNRIDALQHTILIVGGGLFAAFVAVLAAILGLIATQI